MARKAKKRTLKKAPIRRQRSRLEQERLLRRLLVWGVIVVTVLVVGVLSFGVIYERVIKARQPVAIVRGAPITVAEFQARVRYERLQAQAELEQMRGYQSSINPEAPEASYLLQQIEQRISDLELGLSIVGTRSYEQLIMEELIRQEADRRTIAVPPEELQQEIERYFGRDTATATPAPIATPVLTATEPLTATPTAVLTPTPTVVPSPTPTVMSEEAFREEYSRYLREILRPRGISEEMFRSWFEVDTLTRRLQDDMAAEVPTQTAQVELRFLAVDSEERADELVARLDEGEDFEALAEEVEEGEEPAGYVYDADWYTWDMLEKAFGAEWADRLFDMEQGAHSGSVPRKPDQPTPDESITYFVALLLGRDEAREIPPYLHQQLADEAFQEWLDSQQEVVERMEYLHLVPNAE